MSTQGLRSYALPPALLRNVFEYAGEMGQFADIARDVIDDLLPTPREMIQRYEVFSAPKCADVSVQFSCPKILQVMARLLTVGKTFGVNDYVAYKINEIALTPFHCVEQIGYGQNDNVCRLLTNVKKVYSGTLATSELYLYDAVKEAEKPENSKQDELQKLAGLLQKCVPLEVRKEPKTLTPEELDTLCVPYRAADVWTLLPHNLMGIVLAYLSLTHEEALMGKTDASRQVHFADNFGENEDRGVSFDYRTILNRLLWIDQIASRYGLTQVACRFFREFAQTTFDVHTEEHDEGFFIDHHRGPVTQDDQGTVTHWDMNLSQKITALVSDKDKPCEDPEVIGIYKLLLKYKVTPQMAQTMLIALSRINPVWLPNDGVKRWVKISNNGDWVRQDGK